MQQQLTISTLVPIQQWSSCCLLLANNKLLMVENLISHDFDDQIQKSINAAGRRGEEMLSPYVPLSV